MAKRCTAKSRSHPQASLLLEIWGDTNTAGVPKEQYIELNRKQTKNASKLLLTMPTRRGSKDVVAVLERMELPSDLVAVTLTNSLCVMMYR